MYIGTDDIYVANNIFEQDITIISVRANRNRLNVNYCHSSTSHISSIIISVKKY